MANLKFIVRTYKGNFNKDGKSIIFLRYTHKTKVTYLSSGRTIIPEYWDGKNQKIKQSYKGFSLFNVYLEKFRQKTEDIIHKALSKEQEPTVNYVKEKLRQKNEDKAVKVEYIDFFTFFKQFIENSKVTKAKTTITGYKNTQRHLKEYEKYSGSVLTWESFDMNFYDNFRYHMLSVKNAGTNTFGKQIKTLKTVLNEAIERGQQMNQAFRSKKFKVVSEEVENIYLNEEEINKIMNIDLSLNPRLEKVRDLFIVGCYTGLRFSDFTEIKAENIKENYIQIRTKKTNQNVVIPFHPCVKIIMAKYKDKYPNSLPPAISNQKMNNYLKDIGKLAGLNEKIIVTKTKGSNRIETTFNKYELLTTHCARRSFATNLFKQGFSGINIMKITGHKTEKAFMRYIKVNEQEAASMLQQHWDRYYNTSNILRKIA